MNTENTRHCRGFTLVELMGAVLISVMIIFVMYSIFDKVQGTFSGAQNMARVQSEGRIASESLKADLHNLSGAELNTIFGPLPNIEWFDLDRNGAPRNTAELLSPVNPVYVSSYDGGARVITVSNPEGLQSGDVLKNSLGVGPVQKIDINMYRFAGSVPSGPAGGQLSVAHEYLSPPRDLFYKNAAQKICRHHIGFYARGGDGRWRYISYWFGPRPKEDLTQQGFDQRMVASDIVGALWVYVSDPVSRTELAQERINWEQLPWAGAKPWLEISSFTGKNQNGSGTLQTSRVEEKSYALVDCLLHFRVQAVSSADPGKSFSNPATSFDGRNYNPSNPAEADQLRMRLSSWPLFFSGKEVPSCVSVEIIVADKKLVDEMEADLGERYAAQPPEIQKNAKIKFLNENLDRLYFFNQLILLEKGGS